MQAPIGGANVDQRKRESQRRHITGLLQPGWRIKPSSAFLPESSRKRMGSGDARKGEAKPSPPAWYFIGPLGCAASEASL